MLTDEAKELFEEWLKEKDHFLFEGYNPCLKLTDLHSHLLNGYIIEWLDSIGYHIEIRPCNLNKVVYEPNILDKRNDEFLCVAEDYGHSGKFISRETALTKAIEKVNQIINLKE